MAHELDFRLARCLKTILAGRVARLGEVKIRENFHYAWSKQPDGTPNFDRVLEIDYHDWSDPYVADFDGTLESLRKALKIHEVDLEPAPKDEGWVPRATLDRLYQLAVTRGLDVPDLIERLEVDPADLDNGGLREVLRRAILAEDDEWVAERIEED